MDSRVRFSEDDGKNVVTKKTNLTQKIFKLQSNYESSDINDDCLTRDQFNKNSDNDRQTYEATIAEANRILTKSGNFISDRRHTGNLDSQRNEYASSQYDRLATYESYADKDELIKELQQKIGEKNEIVRDLKDMELNYIERQRILQAGDNDKAALLDTIYDLESRNKNLTESKDLYLQEAEKNALSKKEIHMFRSKSDGQENQLDFFKNENQFMHEQLIARANDVESKDCCIEELEFENMKIIEEYTHIISKMKYEIENLNLNIQEERIKNQNQDMKSNKIHSDMIDDHNRKNSLNISNSEAMISNLRLEVSSLKSELERERSKIVEIKNSTFIEFQSKIEMINTENLKAKLEINVIIENLRHENQMLKQDYDFLTDKVTETENDLKMQNALNQSELNIDHKLMVGDLSSELEKFKQQSDNQNLSIENYRSIVIQYENEIEKTKQEKIRDMDNYKNMKDQHHEHEVTRLNNMINEQSSTVFECKEKQQTFELDVARNSTNMIEELYKQNAKTVNDYEKIVDEQNIRVSQLNIDLRDARIQYESTEDTLTQNYEVKVSSLQIQLDSMTKNYSKINLECETKTKAIEQERGSMQQSFLQIQASISETNKNIPLINELEARISNLWKDNQSLREDNEKIFLIQKDCHYKLNMTDSIDKSIRMSEGNTQILHTARSMTSQVNVNQNESFAKTFVKDDTSKINKMEKVLDNLQERRKTLESENKQLKEEITLIKREKNDQSKTIDDLRNYNAQFKSDEIIDFYREKIYDTTTVTKQEYLNRGDVKLDSGCKIETDRIFDTEMITSNVDLELTKQIDIVRNELGEGQNFDDGQVEEVNINDY